VGKQRHNQIEITALVHSEDGMYWAEVPEYPGLFASGETMDELIEALTEAWAMYTHERKPDEAKAADRCESGEASVPSEASSLGLRVPSYA
jgi:predicted RNase H-like HicB family nuclease